MPLPLQTTPVSQQQIVQPSFLFLVIRERHPQAGRQAQGICMSTTAEHASSDPRCWLEKEGSAAEAAGLAKLTSSRPSILPIAPFELVVSGN